MHGMHRNLEELIAVSNKPGSFLDLFVLYLVHHKLFLLAPAFGVCTWICDWCMEGSQHHVLHLTNRNVCLIVSL